MTIPKEQQLRAGHGPWSPGGGAGGRVGQATAPGACKGAHRAGMHPRAPDQEQDQPKQAQQGQGLDDKRLRACGVHNARSLQHAAMAVLDSEPASARAATTHIEEDIEEEEGRGLRDARGQYG